jgi:hypothetical protein
MDSRYSGSPWQPQSEKGPISWSACLFGPTMDARLPCPLQPPRPHSLDPAGKGAARSCEAWRAWPCFDLGHQRPGNAISSEEHLLPGCPQQAQALTPPCFFRLGQALTGQPKALGRGLESPPPAPSNSMETILIRTNSADVASSFCTPTPTLCSPPTPPSASPVTFIVPDTCVKTGTLCSGLHLLLLISHLELQSLVTHAPSPSPHPCLSGCP